MNQTKRFLFQSLLWLVIWLSAWFFLGGNSNFLHEMGFPFLFQVVVIGSLVYLAAPQLLFQKKYLIFILFSIAILVACSFLVPDQLALQLTESNLGPEQIKGPGPGRRPVGRGLMSGQQPPPRFLVNLLILSVAYILATFIETFIFAQKKEEETIRNASEHVKTELKFLKSQINPHFLFNSLNNIYALSAIDSEKTQQSISYLSDMLRYVLYECDQDKVPLEKEVTYIENYIKLFALKSSKKFPITTEIAIAQSNLKIAPMLLIPFMENALKHGNIEKVKNTYIRINLIANSDGIQFNIENSKSKTPMVSDAIGGIGIENVKKRLSILYPNQHQLLIDETSEAFKVNLNIDLNGNN